MKIFNHKINLTLTAIAAVVGLASCDKDGINGYAPTKPIGGYNSSAEIAPGDRVVQFSFDGTVKDSINGFDGTATNTTFATGRKKEAFKGSATGQVIYNTPAAAINNLQSFTVSMWINTQKHDGGAQAVFMIPRTDDFWGNMFMLIEGSTAAHDSMLVKFNFGGQWAELTGNLRLPNMYGAWKHLAFTYNATTSKFATYLNGLKVTLPASMTDRKNGTNPLGPISFTNPSKLIIGGFQQHIGTPWGAPDGWMLRYTGSLDEFRIYKVALSDGDVNALYKLENLGR